MDGRGESGTGKRTGPDGMNRADLRRTWRLYTSARHTAWPYQQPLHRPSWLERAWIRLFG